MLWRGPRKMRAIIQFLSDAGWGDLDYFFIDTPPGTGDEALTAARGVPGLKAVVVTTGHSLSLLDAAKAVSSLRSLSVEISGAVDNMGFMRCPDCGREQVFFEESKVRRFCEKENIPLLARLPLDHGAMTLSEKLKKPILEAAPDSPLAKALRELADKL